MKHEESDFDIGCRVVVEWECLCKGMEMLDGKCALGVDC